MGMLQLAGAVSGFGKGLQQGLQQTQQYMSQSMLLKERDEMEQRRNEITYGRELGLLQMKRGFDKEDADLAHSRSLDKEEQRQDFEMRKGRIERQAGREASDTEHARNLERDQKRGEQDISKMVIGQGYKQQEDATNSKREISKEERDRKFQREKMQTEGSFRLVDQMLQNQRPMGGSGSVSGKLDGNTNAQLNVYADRIGRLEDEMNNVMTTKERRLEIQKEIAKLEGKQNELLGMQSPTRERQPYRFPE